MRRSDRPRAGLARACLDHCRDAPAMRRTLLIALVVGVLLTAINQGGRILAGDVDAAASLRIAANFFVPFCVSSIGFISARRARAGG